MKVSVACELLTLVLAPLAVQCLHIDHDFALINLHHISSCRTHSVVKRSSYNLLVQAAWAALHEIASCLH